MTKPSELANPPRNLPLPGMAAISLWMLVLSIMGVVGVLAHRFPARHAQIAVLLLSTLFATAGLGLMRSRRWGWALTLAAVFLSMCYGFYSLFRLHQGHWIVIALVNLVFFLYLVRAEVVTRLH